MQYRKLGNSALQVSAIGLGGRSMPGTFRRIGREPVANTSRANGSVAPPASFTLRTEGSTAIALCP